MTIKNLTDITEKPLAAMNAEEFSEMMVAILAMGYHPDTPANDYVYGGTDERVFSDEVAREIDETIERLTAEGADLYDIGLRLFHELSP
jgi:hypothetical protein